MEDEKYATASISIEPELLRRGKAYAKKLKPRTSFSALLATLLEKELMGVKEDQFSVMHEDRPDYGSKGKGGKSRTVAIKLP